MAKSRLKLSIIGTHGIPAKYGGFETLADFLSCHLNEKYDITVFCNAKKYSEHPGYYCGVRLKYLSLDASGWQGILYDFITYIDALINSDVILYLSPVGSGFMTPLNLLFRRRVITNHGGLNEWDRPKLNKFQKKWAKFNHAVAAHFSDINVVDNLLYKESLKNNFNVNSVLIRYGGDHVKAVARNDEQFCQKYAHLPHKYAVSVSRAQIDNNIHLVLDAFAECKELSLVMVSNWGVSAYGTRLKNQYKNVPNIILLDAVYEKDELDYIRSNAYSYIHSHSFCGTAPSLVEAMYLGKAIFCYDVPTNRETTQNSAFFFSDSQSLLDILRTTSELELIANAKKMKDIAEKEYRWDLIAQQYSDIIGAY